MSNIQNSDLIKQTIKTLLVITSRRASESVSILLMDTILKTLIGRYNFLKYVKIKSTVGYGEITADAITVDPDVNSVDPSAVGRVIETIIRVICVDLREKAGLFFIKEFKNRVGGNYVSELREIGVDLDLIQLERDYSRTQQQRRKTYKAGAEGKAEGKKPEDTSILGYQWNNVSTWRYKDNMCLLYDKNGKLLDKLHLDQIIENHVRELTEPDVLPETTSESIELDEQHHKLLQLLYSRDLDIDEAKYLMDKSKPEIEYMVYELINVEFLQHESDDTVKITQNGIDYLLSEEEKKLEVKKEKIE
ncbi:MAG: hypothetical protein KAW45_03540 [Thermoplasmatales archaeon]|nr:hypothetical protein [Thermoplasmatales archaeon]